MIGGVEARNRIMFGPHETNLGRDRAISDRQLAYWTRRIDGGVGVLVTEEASVHASDWPYERCPLAELCEPGWSTLAAAAQGTGTVVLAGLGHTGGQGSSAYSQREMWAPSAVPEVNSREVPKVMEPEDIAAVIDGFADATRRAVRAGLHGVEINAGQNSLIRQFMSGLTNMRGDEYGEDRLLFARQVLEGVREAAGDAVVGLRLSCDEMAPWAGIVPEAAAEIAATLSEYIDLLVVVRGAIFTVAETRPDGHTAPGFNLDLVGQIRAAVTGVPVFAQGSIIDPGQANWAVSEGRCDGAEMTRAQIADPDMAMLASADPGRIRPCILCNQTCKVRDARNPIITCVGEPRSGHELEDTDVDRPRHTPVRADSTADADLVVVGGGVAGLEAARVAAQSGRRVVVLERRDRFGGALRTAAAGSGRERLVHLAHWLEAECTRLGVDLRSGVDVSAAMVTDPSLVPGVDGAAQVLICTGGRAGVRTYAVDDNGDPRSGAATGLGGTCLMTAEEVLDGAALPEGPVVVWDPIGGPIGVSIAEGLAAEGRTVAVVTGDYNVGNELSRSGDLAPANVRLQGAGVALHKRSLLRRVGADGAHIEDRFTAEPSLIAAAVVVDAGHRLPDDALWTAAGAEHPRAGDVVAPRTVHEAVLEARRAVVALSRQPVTVGGR